MAPGNLQLVESNRGISPERARADHLARQIELIRQALAPLIEESERLHEAVIQAWMLLERLPRQT